MTINPIRKGYLNQLKTQRWLEKYGWQVYTAPSVKFRRNKDIFHLFDHISHKGETVRFTQTKSNKCELQVRERIKRFKVSAGVIKDVFIWKDYARKPIIIRL